MGREIKACGGQMYSRKRKPFTPRHPDRTERRAGKSRLTLTHTWVLGAGAAAPFLRGGPIRAHLMCSIDGGKTGKSMCDTVLFDTEPGPVPEGAIVCAECRLLAGDKYPLQRAT